MTELKKLGVLSVAKISALLAIVFGLIIGILVAILGEIIDSLTGITNFGAGKGFFTIIIFPIMYGIFGFILGAIVALLYNLFARLVGGINMKLKDNWFFVFSSLTFKN